MKKVKKEEKAHARYSASGSKRWLECPGSIALGDKAPPEPDSPYAIEGTKAHEVFEIFMKNFGSPGKAAIEARAKKYPMEMIVHAENAYGDVVKLMQTHKLKISNGVEVQAEQKADYSHLEPGQFGTLDVAVIEAFGWLIIADFKYGAGVTVDPEHNTQLILYAIAIAKEHHYNFDQVKIVVIQPRAYHPSGKTTREWDTTIENLKEWEKKFKAGIAATKKKDAPLKSGSHCQFCRAAPICPELKNKALRTAQAEFDDDEDLSDLKLPEPTKKTFPAAKLDQVLDATYKIEKWISAIRKHAEGVVLSGGKVRGYGMIPTRPSRSWADAEKSERLAKKLFGAKAFTNPDPELLSPAQLEKLSPKAREFVEKNAVSLSSGEKFGPVKNSAADDFAD